jgi:hypothetical protein
MATCSRCGAAILWKRLDGMPFAVDTHESTCGEGRYVEHGEHLIGVTPTVAVSAFVDHRQTCPSR